MRTDEDIACIIDKAIERVVGFYYEKHKEDMRLILTTLEAIQVSFEVAAGHA